MDSTRRSLVKALLWQTLGLVSMLVIGLMFTGSLKTGGLMALSNAFLGFVVYLAYERVWQKIGWGRRQQVLAPTGIALGNHHESAKGE